MTRTKLQSPGHGRMHHTRHHLVWVMMLGILAAAIASSCGQAVARATDGADVQSLSDRADDGRAAVSATSTTTTPAPSTTSSSDPPTSTDALEQPEPSNLGSLAFPEDAGAEQVVDILLAHYGDVVTTLARDPAATSAADHPARRAWDELVLADSELYGFVLEELVYGALDEGSRLIPGPDGVGHSHHATTVKVVDDDSIDFTFCGYSPGIRVDSTSGEILDDDVARTVGIGRAIKRLWDDRPSWALDQLAGLDQQVMPPGSTNPCL